MFVSQYQQVVRRQATSSNTNLVVTLGDSVTQGGYPKPLQEKLTRDWNVLDFAASGRGMDYVVDALHEKTGELDGKNSVVLLMIGHNDCMYLQSFAQQHHSTKEDVFRVHVQRVFRKSRSYRLLVQVINRFKNTPSATLIREPPPKLGSTQEARYCEQAIDSGIAEINEWRLKYGHYLALVSYPIPANLSLQDRRPDHLIQVNYLVNKLLYQAAKKYDINWVDSAKCMAQKPRSFWEPDAVHLTHEGDVALAECLLDNITLLTDTR